MTHLRPTLLVMLAGLLAAGCAFSSPADPKATGGGGGGKSPPAELVPLGPIGASRFEAGRLAAVEGPVALAGARSETLGFALQLERGKLDPAATLRLTDLARVDGDGPALPATAAELGQVVPLPVDFNRAGYVRQSGAAVNARPVPRAVVPLPAGRVPLSALKPDAEGMTTLWVDLAVPEATPPGEYAGSVEVTDAGGRAVARLPIRLTVYDLVLPYTRSLNVVGRVSWDSLTRQFPDAFEAITPKLINRRDERYKKPVAVLDGLVKLAQRHRLVLTVDRLQPTVKWNPFDVDWRDYDSLVGPWLDVEGSAFADREPLGFWQLPAIDFLSNYPAATRREYYAAAAAHFDAKDWLARSPVWIDPTGEDSGPARQRLLEQASNVLASQPRVKVAVPLEADQLQFADAGVPTLPARTDAARLITASPGLIFNQPIQTGAARPKGAQTFLRTDLAGLIPYAGIGGDERDVRVWAWLAFTRTASILRFDNALPSATKPDVVADPNELVWFYPGSWFGVDQPVASLQMKWLRRAEQDHEYLSLASQRGERTTTFVLARAITKSVQIQPAQRADASYALLTGTADAAAWDQGMRLLAKLILLRAPGAQQVDAKARDAVGLEMLPWLQPQEKPLLMGRTTLFSPEPNGTVGVRVGVDVYNPSDTTPRGNSLSFGAVPRGWTVDPKPSAVPPLPTYQVQRFGLAARVDPDNLDPRQRGRAVVELTNDYTSRATPLPLVVPVAVSRRREGNLTLDGALGDWSDDDAVTLSPLVRMIDRPTLQSHTIADAPTSASVYSGWSESNLYVAFKVAGLANGSSPQAQNFVRYDFRRAWGEDLVEVLVQPVYPDGSLGAALHVACKPNGGTWSERKSDLTEGGEWEPLDAGVRFACNPERDVWRGEVAIPWSAIGPTNAVGGPARMPAMLRFNFVQHQHATGTSASWAGPIDFGRDDQFTGALVLRGGEGR